MTNPVSGRQVPGGWYWNPERLELRTIPPEGGSLPDGAVRWRRLPGWLLISAAPIVGGLFVIGLPVFGAAVIARAVASKTMAGLSRAAHALATTLSPAPSPGEAHLGGHAPGRDAEEGVTPGLDEVEAKIRARQGKAGKDEASDQGE